MNVSFFLALLTHTARDTLRTPFLYLPSALLFAVMAAFNALAPSFPSQLIASPLYPLFSSAFFLFIAAFPLAALLAAASGIVRKQKVTLRRMTSTALRRGVPNFMLLSIIALAYAFLTQLALLVGKALIPLSTSLATLAVLLVLFASLAGILIFFTFANVFCIVHSFSVVHNITQSATLVRKNYLLVLSLSILFFIINALLDFLPSLLAELLRSLLIAPLLALILVRISLSADDTHGALSSS